MKKKEFQKTITDREDFFELFKIEYNRQKEDMNHSHILVFSGDGGIGKTSLLNDLRRYSESESQLSILYDFNQYTQVYLKHMLFTLGNKLYHTDKSKYKFNRFRCAIHKYCEETKDYVIRDIQADFMTDNPWIDLTIDSAQLLEYVPGVGQFTKFAQIIAKLALNIKDESAKRKLQDVVEMDMLQGEELENRFHEYFINDMKEAMKDAEEPLVIFIDTYEKFTISSHLEADKSDRAEKKLAEVVECIPGIMWVIAGRENLSEKIWERKVFNPVEKQLEGFSRPDTNLYLTEKGVEGALFEELYSLTCGIPVFLELCVETNRTLIRRGETPTLERFGEDTTELVERYLKYQDGPTQDISKMLACLKEWDYDMASAIGSKAKSVSFSATNYDVLMQFSFIKKKENGVRCYMHDTIAQIIYKNTKPEFRSDINEVAYNYFIDKYEQSSSNKSWLLVEIVKAFDRWARDNEEGKYTEKLDWIISEVYMHSYSNECYLQHSDIIPTDPFYGEISISTVDTFVSYDDELIILDLLDRLLSEKGKGLVDQKIIIEHFLSDVLYARNEIEEAILVSQKVLEQTIDHYGKADQRSIYTMRKTASYLKEKNCEEAIRLNKMAFEIEKNAFQSEYPGIIENITEPVPVFDDQGDFVDEDYGDFDIEIRHRIYTIFYQLVTLADYYVNNKDYDHALECLNNTYDETIRLYGTGNAAVELIKEIIQDVTVKKSLAKRHTNEAIKFLEEMYEDTLNCWGGIIRVRLKLYIG